MARVLSVILGGGRGSRLYPLTKLRSEPAVPLAGKYRLIDVPVSNCINSGLNRICVLTQFQSASLHRHLASTYIFDPFGEGFVEVLAAQQTNERADWYQGTADAIRQQLAYIHTDSCQHILVLSGDQIYRMDFRRLLQTHEESGADATLALVPMGRERVGDFGVVCLDNSGRVVRFLEKPQTEEQLKGLETPQQWLEEQGVRAPGRPYLASMGIYVFRRKALLKMLEAHPRAVDFAWEVFPRSVGMHHLHAHLFDGYWQDLGTVKAYYEANMALCGRNPPFDFHSPDGVIYTRMRFLPASRIESAVLRDCLVSDGCVVGEGSQLERSVIGLRSHIGRNVVVRDSVLMGADRYETEAERAANRSRGIPDFLLGDGAVVERAILDKDCRIGRNVRIVNRDGLTNAEGDNYVIRDGIVVIPKGAVVADGTVI